MSGEAVLISAMLTPAGLAVAGALAAGTMAAQLVNGWQEERRRRAEARMREEKARIGAWQQFQLNQQDRMESLNRARNQVREQLAALSLNTLPLPLTRSSRPPGPGGFWDGTQPPRRRSPGSRRWSVFSPGCQASFSKYRTRPWYGSASRLSACSNNSIQRSLHRPKPSTICKPWWIAPLTAQLEELERTSEAQKQLTEQGETLLEEVMAYTDLSTETDGGGTCRLCVRIC